MTLLFHFRVIFKILKISILAIFIIAIQVYITPAKSQITSKNTETTLESNVATELAKIKQEKLAIEAKAKEQDAACYKKFAVSSCLKDVKTEKLAALNDAKQREIELNNQLRLKKEKALLEKKENKENKENKDKPETAKKSKTPENPENLDIKPETAKVAKVAKVAKEPKTRTEKTPGDEQQRLNAANKRVAEANQKLAANQKKQQLRANKQSQTNAQSASYSKKLQQAEQHKNELAQKQAAKTKSKSAPLLIPSAAEIAR